MSVAYTLPFTNPVRITGPGTSSPADITFPNNYEQQLMFSNGGATRYAFLVNGPAGAPAPAWPPGGGVPAIKSYIHVMKSVDSGATWAEVGTLNAKQIPPKNASAASATAGFMTMSCYQVGSIILVARPVWDFVTYTGTLRPIVVSQFDMDADDWAADLSVEGDPNAPQAFITQGYYPNYTPFFITQRASDGHVFLLWRTFDFVDLSFSGTDLEIITSGASQSGSDLFILAGTLGSVSYTFVLGDVGNQIYIPLSAGAAGFTPGIYLITGVVAGLATVDSQPGVEGATGGDWVMAVANVFHSATHTFDANDLGRVVHVSSGVGFTVGDYAVTGLQAGDAIVVHSSPPINQNPGAAGSTGGHWSMTNGTRDYERCNLSELSAGSWAAASMVFGTVGEPIDFEPVGITPGDGDVLLLSAQKMQPIWNGDSTVFPTQSFADRTLDAANTLSAIVLEEVTKHAVTGPFQSPMTRLTGGLIEWLMPYVFVYDPGPSTPTTVPAEMRLRRAMSATVPTWATTTISTGVPAPQSPIDAEFFDGEYNDFPVACDLTTETLYAFTPAPLGQGAPFFVPFQVNLFTDTPPFDSTPATIWDESTITSNPLLGVVACANNYLGSAYIGILLSDGPVGEFAYDDVFYFELDFAGPAPVAVTPIRGLASGGMKGCKNNAPPNIWNVCLAREEDLFRHMIRSGWLRFAAGISRDGVSVLEEMPREGNRLFKFAAVPLPADDGLDHPVLRFRMPDGWDAVIIVQTNEYTGPGFVEGSGDLVWRFRAGYRYLPDSGAVEVSRGDLRRPFAVEGAFFQLLSRQVFEIDVAVAIGAAGRLNPAGLVIGAITGYMYPRRPFGGRPLERRELLAKLQGERIQRWL